MTAWRCWLFGHDDTLHIERARVYLRCASCRRMSPGWDVTPGMTFRVRRFKRRLAA